MLTTFSGTIGGQVRQVLLYLSERLSVCPIRRPSLWDNSTATGQNFIKFAIEVIFEKKSFGKFELSLKSDMNTECCL